MLRVAYFVHDLGDAAVLRRVRMLHAGGASVIVIGFRRHAGSPQGLDGAEVVELGATADGRLLHRIWALLRTLIRLAPVRSAVANADVLIARNLESLVMAARVSAERPLVYECLDVHRMLLGHGPASRLVQWIERATLKQVDLILTSSPRFRDDYFLDRQQTTLPVMLLENKVLEIDASVRNDPVQCAAPSPPWVIGWFGMLRCQRTFAVLEDIVRKSAGRVQVLIAGIPSDREFERFDERVSAIPGMTFAGRYKAEELPELYGRVHFAWAIDYFEEGLNSKWLLPNRLYEALAHGVVPIALREVETGNWLVSHGVGVVVYDAQKSVLPILTGLDELKLLELCRAVNGLSKNLIVMRAADCRALVRALADL